jgi:UDP-2,3-diacylglucosamine hydrolase
LSDLHLPAAPSPPGAASLRESFAAFLEGPARKADAVYILGDLFDHWIGDDLGLIDHADEVRQLRAASDAGVALYFMHGNRDFLIGERFAKATGVTLLHDPVELMLGGVPTLLSHGDLYCTGDIAYQRWRRFAHRRSVQRVFLKLPAGLRRRIGGAARGRSELGKRNKPESIMDVDDAAVRAAFERHGVGRIIHGHTHRLAEHRLKIGAHEVERIVLADWRPQQREYLRCTDDRIERIRL